MPAKTYTIATAHDMLIAIVPDGGDIAAEVERTAAEAGVTFDQFDTTTGLTLTDEPLADDQIVVYGDKMGRLTDEDGIGYRYAVKRRDDAADLLRRRRRTDDELASLGGRAAYLQSLREDLAAAQARLDGGFAADDARVDPEIRAMFDAEDPVLWQKQREDVIQQLELALAANSEEPPPVSAGSIDLDGDEIALMADCVESDESMQRRAEEAEFVQGLYRTHKEIFGGHDLMLMLVNRSDLGAKVYVVLQYQVTPIDTGLTTASLPASDQDAFEIVDRLPVIRALADNNFYAGVGP
jgi:hypothetical protein